jgi:SAM-dependent methyltransferase
MPETQSAGPGREQPSEYHRFWEDMGCGFPSLKDAPSTALYRMGEQDLFKDFKLELRDKALFKTDLWDEAKNTEILLWAAEQGAKVYAADISGPMVWRAKRCLGGHGRCLAVGDLRRLPFQDGSMDLIYSMGTIEHFPEYREALKELYRILKPGGRALIGVPNKLDPFLRPLMVGLLNLVKAYDYGMELSFTPAQLRRELEAVGFEYQATSGLLFIPGWMRMLDLLFHTRSPRLTCLTKPWVKLFSTLHRRFPAVRRHGYLLAMLAQKPA